MSKRPAEPSEDEPSALKAGDRPPTQNGGEGLDFEDEFEDEFESDEDEEIFEAGVDGRPDAEREAEEKEST